MQKISKNPDKSLGKDFNENGIGLSKPLTDYRISTENWSVIGVFVLGLGAILYGVFNLNWYINEISAIFLMVTLATGIIAKMGATNLSETILKAVAYVAPGAFMVGFATTIKVLMEMGHISDTISFHLSEILKTLPLYLSAIGMSVSQSVSTFLSPLEAAKL